MSIPSPVRVANRYANRTASESFEDRILETFRKTGWARDNAEISISEYAMRYACKGMSKAEILTLVKRSGLRIDFDNNSRNTFLYEIADILKEVSAQYDTGDVQQQKPGVFEIFAKTEERIGDDEKLIRILSNLGGRNVSVDSNVVRVTFEVNLEVIRVLESNAINEVLDWVVKAAQQQG